MTASDAGAHVLLVEDEEDIREVVAEILEYHGHHVVRASGGREALARLDEGARPDVILLDLMMPIMSGWAFRELLLERPALSDIPVVVFSGVDELGSKSAHLTVAGFLRKPVDLTDLLTTVERFHHKAEAP